MIEVYGYPQTRSIRICWILEELSEQYKFNLIDFSKGENLQSAYLQINPSGKIPAISIDGMVMTESGAIVTYLADCYPEAGLIPITATENRSRYEQWSYFTLTELEQALWTIAKHRFALPAEHRVSAVLDTARWEFQQALELLSKGLADKPYILGDNFSAADILVTQTLQWANAFHQVIKQKNVIAYVERCSRRPALKRAREQELL